MRNPRPIRDLERLKWIGVVVPIALIWAWELARSAFVDGTMPAQDEHILSALILAGGIVLFGIAMAVLLERTQHEILRQNRDLTALTTVGSAVRGDQSIAHMASQALERMIEQTGALGGVIAVDGPEGDPVIVRRPDPCPVGLGWVAALLDEPVRAEAAVELSERPDLETLILDLRFDPRMPEPDRMRLVFHPPIRPNISDSVLAELSREIETSLRIERLVADLRRREHERGALYELALQLTERAETPAVMDRITHYARELLAADRAVVCLADQARTGAGVAAQRAGGPRTHVTDRLAVADDGRTCLLAQLGEGPTHDRNPLCPSRAADPDVAWLARPLRGPGELLGELCVTRPAARPFTEAERTLLGALADMAAIAVRTARLHEAEEQMTILSERDRIARELHDSLAQVLGQIHLTLRGLEARTDGAAISTDLAELADTADEAYRDVRETILGLRESIPSDGGLEAALRAYLAKYSRQTGIATHLDCDGLAGRALSPKAEVQLLRVVQEALTNVRKHAQASEVRVDLHERDGTPVLSVTDDGSGFDPSSVGPSLTGGFGLRSMRERVELLGGTLDVLTAPGDGTRIVATLRPEGPHVAPAATSPAAR
ncbi:MAG TPA: GAF domain-containing sensor histidine kinase [Candidatus Sulfomarinibacteraceae bacterium]|nr:GAF domain-containing sensor histidine kinase [Candidatus Sulfomarinibacteraceae bacterium]